MSIRISQIDAFTSELFSGNPAAVCVLPASRSAQWMQQVACEMNLSETAFLLRRDDGFALRWFTPTHEVDLCGHATLASAHVLWTEGHLPGDEPAVFHTKSGQLTARRHGDWIAMDFPAEPLAPVEEVPPVLETALGVSPAYIGRNRMDYAVLLESETAVRDLDPDLARLATIETRGVIVTAPSDEDEYDFVSRFFAPRVGVPEDPVTGSAHCALGPFWAERLGRIDLMGRQISARGGTVRMQMEHADADRILLMGPAVTVFQGELVGEHG